MLRNPLFSHLSRNDIIVILIISLVLGYFGRIMIFNIFIRLICLLCVDCVLL